MSALALTALVAVLLAALWQAGRRVRALERGAEQVASRTARLRTATQQADEARRAAAALLADDPDAADREAADRETAERRPEPAPAPAAGRRRTRSPRLPHAAPPLRRDP